MIFLRINLQNFVQFIDAGCCEKLLGGLDPSGLREFTPMLEN